jgi:hypothetical protein
MVCLVRVEGQASSHVAAAAANSNGAARIVKDDHWS